MATEECSPVTDDLPEIELFGLDISVYTRIARLALLEKKVDYRLTEIDVFAEAGPPIDYLNCHPFGAIPSLRHKDLVIFETSAITRYVDEAFEGPKLQASTAARRARSNQIISLLDAYAYRSMVWEVYVQRVERPEEGGVADQSVITSGLKQSKIVLDQLAGCCTDSEFLGGDQLTLADLYALPMLSYFVKTEEGAAMLECHTKLTDWLQRMQQRSSSLTLGISI